MARPHGAGQSDGRRRPRAGGPDAGRSRCRHSRTVSRGDCVHQTRLRRTGRRGGRAGDAAAVRAEAGKRLERCRVIEGFRIELTADERYRHLRDRARHHRAAAAERANRQAMAGSTTSVIDSRDPDRQLDLIFPGWVDEFDEYGAEHRRLETAFEAVAEHVVPLEVYRLDRSDLRFLEMWPPREPKRFWSG